MPPGLKFERAASNFLVLRLTHNTSVLDLALQGARALGQIGASDSSLFRDEVQDLLDGLGMTLQNTREVMVRHGHFLAVTVSGARLTLELPL